MLFPLFFSLHVSRLSAQQMMMLQQITVWCEHSLRSGYFRKCLMFEVIVVIVTFA